MKSTVDEVLVPTVTVLLKFAAAPVSVPVVVGEADNIIVDPVPVTGLVIKAFDPFTAKGSDAVTLENMGASGKVAIPAEVTVKDLFSIPVPAAFTPDI
jgi:hypothetical protein